MSLSSPSGTRKSKEDVAKEILHYFVQHPDAADNFLGIARWRLLQEEVHRNVEITEEALKWLVEQGYLQRVPVKGLEDIFQINPGKVREAKVFINEQQDDVDPTTK